MHINSCKDSERYVIMCLGSTLGTPGMEHEVTLIVVILVRYD